jgi:hypothetical protein
LPWLMKGWVLPIMLQQLDCTSWAVWCHDVLLIATVKTQQTANWFGRAQSAKFCQSTYLNNFFVLSLVDVASYNAKGVKVWICRRENTAHYQKPINRINPRMVSSGTFCTFCTLYFWSKSTPVKEYSYLYFVPIRIRKCYWEWDCRFIMLKVHLIRKQITFFPGFYWVPKAHKSKKYNTDFG